MPEEKKNIIIYNTSDGKASGASETSESLLKFWV
jgi:hypothetical protein